MRIWTLLWQIRLTAVANAPLRRLWTVCLQMQQQAHYKKVLHARCLLRMPNHRSVQHHQRKQSAKPKPLLLPACPHRQRKQSLEAPGRWLRKVQLGAEAAQILMGAVRWRWRARLLRVPCVVRGGM
mmetsp:Transcript_26027/g.74515  ORF Transcript_26027/g.74515 Transcript_26027/m.74515 type:complete len:126 (+) Transcript_26027:1516-1893(+)